MRPNPMLAWNKRGADHRHGKDLEREDDLLDEVRHGHDEAGRAPDRFGEKGEDGDAAEDHEGELCEALGRPALRPSGLEDDAEHERVDDEKDERIQERPEEAQKGAPVPPLDLAPRELPDQVPPLPECP